MTPALPRCTIQSNRHALLRLRRTRRWIAGDTPRLWSSAATTVAKIPSLIQTKKSSTPHYLNSDSCLPGPARRKKAHLHSATLRQSSSSSIVTSLTNTFNSFLGRSNPLLTHMEQLGFMHQDTDDNNTHGNTSTTNMYPPFENMLPEKHLPQTAQQIAHDTMHHYEKLQQDCLACLQPLSNQTTTDNTNTTIPYPSVETLLIQIERIHAPLHYLQYILHLYASTIAAPAPAPSSQQTRQDAALANAYQEVHHLLMQCFSLPDESTNLLMILTKQKYFSADSLLNQDEDYTNMLHRAVDILLKKDEIVLLPPPHDSTNPNDEEQDMEQARQLYETHQETLDHLHSELQQLMSTTAFQALEAAKKAHLEFLKSGKRPPPEASTSRMSKHGGGAVTLSTKLNPDAKVFLPLAYAIRETKKTMASMVPVPNCQDQAQALAQDQAQDQAQALVMSVSEGPRGRQVTFDNYLDMYLHNHGAMAQDKHQITALHNTIATKALPRAQEILQGQQKTHLQKQTSEEESDNQDDEAEEQQQQQKDMWLNLKEGNYKPHVWFQLAPYLELSAVLDGMFHLTQRLFGVSFQQVHARDGSEYGVPQVWHDDVRVYHVFDNYDESNNNNNSDQPRRPIACLYLDPYKRPRGGKAQDASYTMPIHLPSRYENNHTHTNNQSESRLPTLVCMSCNIDPPMWDHSPCLLSFDEVESLYHELGHALHLMLTQPQKGAVADGSSSSARTSPNSASDYETIHNRYTPAMLSGLNGVEFDAVEFPSQFMALWLYHGLETTASTSFSPLRLYAKHWKTDEPIPEELLQTLHKERLKMAPFRLLTQIYEGQLEVELYGKETPRSNNQNDKDEEADDAPPVSMMELQSTLSQRYTPYSIPPDKTDVSTLAHIFASGSAFGSPEFRYRYVWAEAMSWDAMDAFLEAEALAIDGRNEEGEEAVRRVGRKFRDTIFSMGGRAAADEVFERFRGRKVELDAMLRHNGLFLPSNSSSSNS